MRMSFPRRPLPARGPAGTLMRCLVLALVGAVLSACSGDTSAPPDATASHAGATTATSAAAGPPELSTAAQVGRVVGRLPAARRQAVRKQVTSVIDRWWEAAYLADARPGARVSSAFPGFTRGARRRATFDRELMTNADVDASSLTPLMRKVRLDLLAVGGRARSVTARFDLRVRAGGQRTRRLQVRGRLFLTRGPAGWQVFGYDVSKGWL